MWKCKISFWAIGVRQFLPEVVNAVEQTNFSVAEYFLKLGEKPHVDFSPTLTISCVLRVRIFRCVQLHCPELPY